MLNKIESHKIAAKRLCQIKDRVFDFIGRNLGKITEYDVQQSVLKEFELNGLTLLGDKDEPIVASDKNTSFVHYFPKKESRLIEKENLILVDIWAKLKEEEAVFADITWMAYTGKKVPQEIQEAFDNVIRARDLAIKIIQDSLMNKKLPDCKEIDEKARESFKELSKNFLHTTGHSLGNMDCHGKDFTISGKCDKKIYINVPFTIEPGIYFEDKFGIRSEIDCYINENYELIITTDLQDKIVLI